MTLKVLKTDNNKVVDSNNKTNEMVVNLLKNNKSKNLTYMLNVEATKKSTFLTSNIKKIFNHLRQTFILTPIVQHFNLENYIQIKINTSSYTIGGVLSELNLDFDVLLNNSNKSDFGQWHLIAYFLKKMIFTKT